MATAQTRGSNSIGSYLMAAMAPELWPTMMVFSSQCSSVSMKGSQMLSRAVTVFRVKQSGTQRGQSHLPNKQQFTTLKLRPKWERRLF